MRVRMSELVDVVGIASISGGFGSRFGWWLTAVVAGLLVIVANWARSK